jgi:hypothetical protein
MTDWSVTVNEEGQANCRNGTQACFMVTGGELALALLEGHRRARRGLGRMVIGLPIGAALADREYAASFCADPANAKKQSERNRRRNARSLNQSQNPLARGQSAGKLTHNAFEPGD